MEKAGCRVIQVLLWGSTCLGLIQSQPDVARKNSRTVQVVAKKWCVVCGQQVDEPALREGLPLKANRWDDYLRWAVDAFRVTCATAKPETQVSSLSHRQFAAVGSC